MNSNGKDSHKIREMKCHEEETMKTPEVSKKRTFDVNSKDNNNMVIDEDQTQNIVKKKRKNKDRESVRKDSIKNDDVEIEIKTTDNINEDGTTEITIPKNKSSILKIINKFVKNRNFINSNTNPLKDLPNNIKNIPKDQEILKPLILMTRISEYYFPNLFTESCEPDDLENKATLINLMNKMKKIPGYKNSRTNPLEDIPEEDYSIPKDQDLLKCTLFLARMSSYYFPCILKK